MLINDRQTTGACVTISTLCLRSPPCALTVNHSALSASFIGFCFCEFQGVEKKQVLYFIVDKELHHDVASALNIAVSASTV